MKLPKRDLPMTSATLPISGIAFQYRPYNIKEKKIIQLAKAAGVDVGIRNALVQVAENCTSLDVLNLCEADFEYLIIKLIAASHSSIIPVDIEMDCGAEKCPKTHACAANLDTVKTIGIDELKRDYKAKKDGFIIPFDDVSGVCMTLVSDGLDDGDRLHRAFKYYYSEDEIFDEFSKDDVVDWAEGLLESDYNKLIKFISQQPKNILELEARCTQCSTQINNTVEGVLDFLA